MIDASKGFKKDGPKNRLRDQDLHKIVDVFNNQIPKSRYSRMVSFKEIEANDYNLNIPRYIDSSTPEDLHDLSAHLCGGIPNADLEALDSYWKVFPSLRRTLFTADREGYSKALVKAAEVKNTILEHPEFKDFAEISLALFQRWKEQARVDGKFWVNNAHVMQPKSDFNIDDLTAFLESLDYSLLNSGTAQLKLNKQSCLSVKVAKPKKPEQTTIANVLSDMDKEIDALEHRLNKTQQLKQGMMQELLTGKTRLVQPKHSLPTNDRKEYVHE